MRFSRPDVRFDPWKPGRNANHKPISIVSFHPTSEIPCFYHVSHNSFIWKVAMTTGTVSDPAGYLCICINIAIYIHNLNKNQSEGESCLVFAPSTNWLVLKPPPCCSFKHSTAEDDTFHYTGCLIRILNNDLWNNPHTTGYIPQTTRVLFIVHLSFSKSPDDEIRIVDTWRSFAWPIGEKHGCETRVSHYKFTMFYHGSPFSSKDFATFFWLKQWILTPKSSPNSTSEAFSTGEWIDFS